MHVGGLATRALTAAKDEGKRIYIISLGSEANPEVELLASHPTGGSYRHYQTIVELFSPETVREIRHDLTTASRELIALLPVSYLACLLFPLI